MEGESTVGKMEECMRVSITLIKSMDLGLISGQMEESTLDSGPIANEMGKVR